MTARATPTEREVWLYNGATNDYDLAKDPRCLFGWGPPYCDCQFGHMCCRPLGHPGQCRDYLPEDHADSLQCQRRHRPKAWDSKLRAEANA